MTSTTTFDLAGLRGADDLSVRTPGEPGYDDARLAWNLAIEHRPLAVATPRSAAGVIAVVDFAREHHLPVAIQSTGHGPTRAAEDAILIDMSGLTAVEVDLGTRRARIGGGARWQAVLDVAAPHGLVPLLGSTPDVSAVGYTLGGGLGWLARRYGTSADSVHAFEVVTADGQLVRAAPDENEELFWALRGAGAGHLGVVTAMEVQLYPIRELYAGNLFYPGSLAVEVMKRWRDWLPGLPEGLTSAVTMINYPALEEVPEPFRGQSFVLIRGAFDGPPEEGEALLAYWRDWRAPLIDGFGRLPIARIAEISDDPLEPLPYEGTGLWLSGLGDDSIEELVSATFAGSDPLLVQTELRHIGGAVARGSSVASAFGNRDAAILLELVGITPTEERVLLVRELIEAVRPRLGADLTGGHYLNYVEGDERRHGVQSGVAPGAYERLAALKRRIDPLDLFDHGLDVTG